MDLELSEIELKHAGLRIHDEAERRRLAASVVELGQRVPVVVVARDQRYVLIDGLPPGGRSSALGPRYGARDGMVSR